MGFHNVEIICYANADIKQKTECVQNPDLVLHVAL